MLELPEVMQLAAQLNAHVAGKTVARVLPPTKPHKFCWFSGDPDQYHALLCGASVVGARGFGIYAEMAFSNGQKLAVNDGVNLRLVQTPPKDYQLLILFEDGSALAFMVAMYGGIMLHTGMEDNSYYQASQNAPFPLSPVFPDHFRKVLQESKPSLSAKAFLATEQRFPGVGNGVLQDILFEARIHPKRKLRTLTTDERERLLDSVISVLSRMIADGGRDTERDLFGRPGGYLTRMSRNTLDQPCPVCGGTITKEAYMGGAVYYCPICQPKER